MDLPLSGAWVHVKFRVREGRYYLIWIALIFGVPAAISFLQSHNVPLSLVFLIPGLAFGALILFRPFSPSKGFRDGEASLARSHLFVRVPGKDILPLDAKKLSGILAGESGIRLKGTGTRSGFVLEMVFDDEEDVNRIAGELRESGCTVDISQRVASTVKS
jgi:hypothetical protein